MHVYLAQRMYWIADDDECTSRACTCQPLTGVLNATVINSASLTVPHPGYRPYRFIDGTLLQST